MEINLKQRTMNRILVLCVGNICRSPMAQGMFKQAMPEAVVCSAGLRALSGHPADPLAIHVMRKYGMDITSHRARSVTPQLVASADLILTMDSAQKYFVENQFVTSRGKVMRLGEFRNYDIADPYGRGMEEFEAAFSLIRDGVEHYAEKIMQLA